MSTIVVACGQGHDSQLKSQVCEKSEGRGCCDEDGDGDGDVAMRKGRCDEDGANFSFANIYNTGRRRRVGGVWGKKRVRRSLSLLSLSSFLLCLLCPWKSFHLSASQMFVLMPDRLSCSFASRLSYATKLDVLGEFLVITHPLGNLLRIDKEEESGGRSMLVVLPQNRHSIRPTEAKFDRRRKF